MASGTSAPRRVGYLVAAGVNVVLLWLVNVWPGWEVVPVFTAEAADVVRLVNISLVFSVVVNLVYSVRDPAWLKALGSVVTTGIALAVTIRTLRVFPFDFGDSGVDLSPLVRLGLWFFVVVLSIALITQLVTFFKVVGASDGGGRG